MGSRVQCVVLSLGRLHSCFSEFRCHYRSACFDGARNDFTDELANPSAAFPPLRIDPSPALPLGPYRPSHPSGFHDP